MPPDPRPGEIVELPELAAHHARRVLRFKAGDAVVLLNGEGGECVQLEAKSGPARKGGVRCSNPRR